MRRVIVLAALACGAQLAHAGVAGKVIFTAGKASVADHAAAVGTAVEEGQALSTGPDGFLYVKTIDNGLFILRPNSQARISAYHVDTQHPENTRVKLDLLSGVARSRSGTAVKQARQNFRFNTPVAAIGVRGTDFTVFTDNDISRVAVISGAIVMSGFGDACRADALGPCEGGASRVLSAAQRGQLLQLQRGQAAPQLLQSSPLSPDQVSPPRADEPLSHAGSTGGGANATGQPNLDAEKTANLGNVVVKTAPPPLPPVVTPPVVTPPVVTPPAPVVVELALPDRDVVWGRWQVVAGLPPKFNLPNTLADNELLSINGNYALLRSQGPDTYVAPNNGSIGFQLKGGEAFIYTDYTPTYRIETPATLSNGTLTVDFGSKSFATGVDLSSGAETFKLSGAGSVGADGRLYGDAANGQTGVMNLQGLLSKQNGGSAAYIFDSRIDDKRSANGATYWQKN
jgi:hypothetical protein